MDELIKHFGIDWKLLLAQAVNFLILLVVLKKFAYGPILKVLKKRKDEIERGLKFTKEAGERLEQIEEEKEAVLKEARGEALGIVSQAENMAKIRKDEIVGEAAKKSGAVVAEAKRVIAEEKAKMGEEVYESAGELVRLAVAKVLGKMPAKDRDSVLVQEALGELKNVYKSR